MTEENTAKIELLIRQNFYLPKEPLDPDRRLRTELAHTEMWICSLVMALEDEFTIDITEDEEDALRTVKDVLALMAGKLAVDA
jgi:acyl carrier protein